MNEMGSAAAARRLFVALDFPNAESALAMAGQLAPLGVGLKVGLELYVAEGPRLLERLTAAAPLSPVFLDLKFHDIPATVAGAVRSATRHGVAMMNLHLSGGEAMARAAVKARGDVLLADEGREEAAAPLLLGVTVLTSLDGDDLRSVWGEGIEADPSAHALRLAKQARDWELDGVVASAREAAAIREACGENFLIVTPGIRPAGGAADDQKRILSPADALAAGASHLVVGRPITKNEDPLAACRAILADMAASLS